MSADETTRGDTPRRDHDCDGQMWSIDELIENMKDATDDAGSRALFARALGERGAEASSAIPALIDALSENHPSLQMEAADALGKMGAVALTAVPSLQHLKDTAPSSGVRTAASDAITALTNPREYQRIQRRRQSGGIVLLVLAVILLLAVWLLLRMYLSFSSD